MGLDLSGEQTDAVVLPRNPHLCSLAGECASSSSVLYFCAENEEHVTTVARD